MILVDNVNVLRQANAVLLDNTRKLEEIIEGSPVKYELARNGMPNISVLQDGHKVYLHSQYDPVNEATRFIDQFSEYDVAQFDHVFFYGIGMGYHVELFLKRFPNVPYTLYEPSPESFYHYLSVKKLEELPLKQLKQIYVEFTVEFLDHHLDEFIGKNKEKVLFVVPPSYERIFPEKYKKFMTTFKTMVENKRSSLHVNLSFEKRWTLNSLITLEYSIQSPNALNKGAYFAGKPALLVAAGPSLSEEIDHLREIKAKGLAYIFAVGSSIKALLANGIYPDAVCAYDPQENTVETYEQIIRENITEIPLIYGSSVGFETVQEYPGPKLHVLLNQDSAAPIYLRKRDGQPLDIVSDAPSIAVVALELLYRLGANPIVLVGQNFAYKNDQFYAEGISYQTATQNRPTAISEAEKAQTIQVEDVDGGMVSTTTGFNRMKIQMEAYTSQFRDREILNTTQGGAKIANTVFVPLAQLLQDRLHERVVDADWFKGTVDGEYDMEYNSEQCKFMEGELKEFSDRLKKLAYLLQDMQRFEQQKNEKRLSSLFTAFDKEFKKMQKNKILDAILAPMNRVQYDLLAKETARFRFEPSLYAKAKKLIDSFGPFLHQCEMDFDMVQPIFDVIHRNIRPKQLPAMTIQ
jgi:hypothetical protein